MLFQFVQQRTAADVERLGAAHPVATVFLQGPDDDFPLQAMRHLAQGAGEGNYDLFAFFRPWRAGQQWVRNP